MFPGLSPSHKQLSIIITLLVLPAVCTPNPLVTTRLLVSSDSIQPGVPFQAAIQCHIEDGWHLYWKNPGDSGMPPKIDWKAPAGFKVTPMQWPTPMIIRSGGLVTYGYEKNVVFLVQITAPEAPLPKVLSFDVTINWLVCKEVCIPGKEILRMTHADGGWDDTALTDKVLLQASEKELPIPLPAQGIRAEQNADTLVLSFNSIQELRGVDPMTLIFFPEQEGWILTAVPQVKTWSTNDLFTITLSLNATAAPKQIRGILTWEGNPQHPGFTIDTPLN